MRRRLRRSALAAREVYSCPQSSCVMRDPTTASLDFVAIPRLGLRRYPREALSPHHPRCGGGGAGECPCIWRRLPAEAAFPFKNDLRHHRSGDVSAGLCVIDEKLLAPLYHCRETSRDRTALLSTFWSTNSRIPTALGQLSYA